MSDSGTHERDDLPPWYEGNAEIVVRNVQLKERMVKDRQKRKEKGVWEERSTGKLPNQCHREFVKTRRLHHQ